jgi:preprotein translocase subunit SecB
MTMPTTAERKSNLKPAAYQAFIASLDLYTIGLTEMSCKIQRDEYWKKDEEHVINYKLRSKSVSIEQKHFDVRSTFMLDMTGEKSKSTVIRVEASFDLHFHASAVSKEFVEKFCESEIRLIVMPYFRELVTDVTARMHIPPLILPLSTKGE